MKYIIRLFWKFSSQYITDIINETPFTGDLGEAKEFPTLRDAENAAKIAEQFFNNISGYEIKII